MRFSRDKRGYEYIYLVHAPTGRGQASRPHVLYWYRTPPAVKVGREPFDEDVRKALEERHPGIDFDWKKIREAQAPPPPEVEHWRERRRAERSAKQARTAATSAELPVAEAMSQVEQELDEAPKHAAELTASDPVVVQVESTPAEGTQAARGRRRRRGGRRRRRQDGSPDPSGTFELTQAAPGEGASAAVTESEAAAPALSAEPEASPGPDQPSEDETGSDDPSS